MNRKAEKIYEIYNLYFFLHGVLEILNVKEMCLFFELMKYFPSFCFIAWVSKLHRSRSNYLSCPAMIIARCHICPLVYSKSSQQDFAIYHLISFILYQDLDINNLWNKISKPNFHSFSIRVKSMHLIQIKLVFIDVFLLVNTDYTLIQRLQVEIERPIIEH